MRLQSPAFQRKPGDAPATAAGMRPFSSISGHSPASYGLAVEQGAWLQGKAVAQSLLEATEDRHTEPATLVLATRLLLCGSTAPPRVLRGRPGGFGLWG